ncbi:hypothetical protein CC79DRAFT_412592 [Sarocladium strictum]
MNLAAGDRFTFVNLTNAPKLSRKAANRARGHVTKATWTKYRAAKAQAVSSNALLTCQRIGRDSSQTKRLPQYIPEASEQDLATLLSEAIVRTDHDSAARLLMELWPIIFSADHHHAATYDAAWRKMFISEPAFMEATVASALRGWSPGPECEKRANYHYDRAYRMAIQRMSSKSTLDYGLMGFMMTMAVDARIALDDEAWKVHMDGILQFLRSESRSNGHEVQFFFVDLLIMDAVNYIFGFPRVYDAAIVEQLGRCSNDRDLLAVSQLADRIVAFGAEFDRGEYAAHPSQTPLEMQQEWMEMAFQCRCLHMRPSVYVKMVATAMELVLHLTVYDPGDGPSMGPLAERLYEAYRLLPGTICVRMELTSCPVMIGTIASKPGSDARRWFIDKLETGVKAQKARGWEDPTRPMFAALASDKELSHRFERIWIEETSLLRCNE